MTVRRLDDILAEEARFMKIDVEGYETEVRPARKAAGGEAPRALDLSIQG